MIKQYFQQAWAQLRQNPIISVVNVTGTALAIFLIMLVVMVQQVDVEPFAPENNRDRMLYYNFISVTNSAWGEGDSNNGCMSVQVADQCFRTLQTPEACTVYTIGTVTIPVNMPGQAAISVDMKETDDVFWRVFDFSFTDGKPYDKATFDAGQPVAVITRSVARALFGTDSGVAGREFLLNHAPYRVAGVVRDVSTLASMAYSQIWIPYTSTDTPYDTDTGGIMGNFSCALLARSRDDFPAIRAESDRSVRVYNTSRQADGWEIIMRNRPYDQEKNALATSSNNEPDLQGARIRRLMVYLILLLVPAINLSSMTQSRLRRRLAEIGVRRAFGCTRAEVAGQILAENLIVTLLAGVLGLALSLAFAFVGNDLLFAQSFSRTLNPPVVSLSILVHLSTFGWALLFCFVLNLLSSGIPAWHAARVNVVEAISGRL